MLVKKNIGLIIETDPSIRDKITKLLGSKLKSIVVAEHAKDFLKLYHELKPDLVVTDYKLPDLEGDQLIESLKKHDAALPALLLATQCPNIVILNLLRFEKFAALHKPFEPMTFLHAINLILKSELTSKFPQPRSAYRVNVVVPTHIEHCGYGRTVNISLTGALIEIKEDIKIGREVHCHFYAPDELVLKGVVIWHRSYKVKDQEPGGLGVRFHGNSNQAHETLRVFLANTISLQQKGWITEQTINLSDII